MPDVLPPLLFENLHHGGEESYLEFKRDFNFVGSRPKRLEVIQTIAALSNERGGGVIIIGVKDNGEIEGMIEENFHSFDHDGLSEKVEGKFNQPIGFKLDKFEIKEGRFIFIQVDESREVPTVYISGAQRAIEGNLSSDLILREGALYVRTRNPVGNREIQTVQEWHELIERTYRKYERETLRRSAIISGSDPYAGELSI